VTNAALKARVPHGERTRLEILDVAERLAAREGLEGLTIGQLAVAVGMSKTGLFAHFGSKEALQLATVEAAFTRFSAEVIEPVLQLPPGVRQIREVFEHYFAYVEKRSLTGGCFFTAASQEMDDRPGPVRDQILRFVQMRDSLVVDGLRQAVKHGELRKGLDVEQLAFELVGLANGASVAFQLTKDRKVLERVRVAFTRLLDEARGPKGKRA
jgi:AcrR family transcriptional regulator